MINLDLLWLLLLTGFSAWVLSIFLTIPFAVLLNSDRRSPAVRRQRLLLVVALPWIGPLTGVAVALLPALLSFGGYLVDHCYLHGLDHHPHLCFAHLPVVHIHILQMVFLAFVACMLGLRHLAYLWRELSLRRRLDTILQFAGKNKALAVIDAPLPTAFTAGILKPQIIIGRYLRDALTVKERHAVVRHEIAHIRARDPLHNFLFEMALLAHLPWVAKRLRRQWRQTLEEQADNHALRKAGDAFDLANALVKTAKLQLHSENKIPLGVLGIHGGDTVERIHRLLNPTVYSQGKANWNVIAAIAVALLLFLSPFLHHGLESFLSHIVLEHRH